jgi:protein-S-isoprenylcysteine O-methyltransferase Ste14
MLIAWYVRQKALNDLGQNYGHEIKLFKKHELVQKGIYSHMRHPLYFGLIVDTFGAVLIASSPFGVFFFITFILVVFRRISHEDRALVDHFGEEAEKYHKRVAAIPLWPF